MEVLVDTGSEVYKGVKKLTTEMLNKQLLGDARAELRKRLTPNYPPGCKSILISADCYPALSRPNVTLETGEIVDVTPKGIRCLLAGIQSKDRTVQKNRVLMSLYA